MPKHITELQRLSIKYFSEPPGDIPGFIKEVEGMDTVAKLLLVKEDLQATLHPLHYQVVTALLDSIYLGK